MKFFPWQQESTPKEEHPSTYPQQDTEQARIPHFISLHGLNEAEIQTVNDLSGGQVKYRRARAHENF